MKSAPFGRVYTWIPDPEITLGGHVALSTEPLPRLESSEQGRARLCGQYAKVRNAGAVVQPDEVSGEIQAVSVGDAQPNSDGDFIFEPSRGGGRMDKCFPGEPYFRWRYIQASHFGEVNTYFHLDRIAAYVDELLHELGFRSFPRVKALVSAHHAATEWNGLRDGVRGTRSGRWLPFQGGHYRLPSWRYDPQEFEPLSATGEIHLGPGWQLLRHGALVERAGAPYRANASHNAAIIYHEYGHHVMRHTADVRANALRPPELQSNRKAAIDEGTSDYWVAAMLGTPHIWAWHRRHDTQETHPRSLTSTKTMADYDPSAEADPHTNGTIWAAALWDLRTQLATRMDDGARATDRLVLRSLLLMGQLTNSRKELSRARASYEVGLAALVLADELLHAGRNRNLILTCFADRGIRLSRSDFFLTDQLNALRA